MQLTNVDPVILGAIANGCDTGYDIKRMVDDSTRFFWAASYGQIYPALRRLEEGGLVTGADEPTGGRPRTVYRLTAAGHEALRDWLRSPGAGWEVRDAGLLKVFFAGALEREEAIATLRAMREDREALLDRIREIGRDLEHVSDWKRLVLEYGIDLHAFIVDWCRRAEERLAAPEEGS